MFMYISYLVNITVPFQCAAAHSRFSCSSVFVCLSPVLKDVYIYQHTKVLCLNVSTSIRAVVLQFYSVGNCIVYSDTNITVFCV